MVDFSVMMRDQARNGLQAQLETATTNGDFEAVKKITGDLEKLAVATAPKAPPYGNDEIKAALDKQDWFGTDPKKSAKAVELGKSLDPKKFATAELFAAAVVKAVDEEFKPAAAAGGENEELEDEELEDEESGETGKGKDAAKPAKTRRTDAPGEGDSVGRARRTSAGPWTKMSDAPTDIQKEINRTADKFAPKTEDGRKKFIVKALEAQYTAFQRNRKTK